MKHGLLKRAFHRGKREKHHVLVLLEVALLIRVAWGAGIIDSIGI
jgi:hypothetical protein